MKIREISDDKTFQDLRSSWNNLLGGSAQASVFLTHEWLSTWWAVYGKKGKLFILLCEDEQGIPMGIFPGYLSRKGPFRIIRFLGSKHVTSDYLDIISAEGKEGDVYEAMFSYLFVTASKWDSLYLTDVPELSRLRVFLSGSDSGVNAIAEDNEKRCPRTRLPNCWDTYLKTLSPGMQRKIGYYRRNLGRKGTLAFESVKEKSELEAVLPEIIRLHDNRMGEKGCDERWSKEGYRNFHVSVMTKFLENGVLDLCLLRLNERCISYKYSYKYHDSIYFYQTGYDSAYKNLSPGFVLTSYRIEQAIKDGYLYYDFLRGEESYKYEWGAVDRKLLDYHIPRDSIGGSAYWRSTAARKSVIRWLTEFRSRYRTARRQ